MSATVYRMYDEADTLLYVGISGHWPGRLTQHEGDKPWWGTVSRASLEHFADRASAVAAEKRAIAAEGPRYNITGTGSRPRRNPRSPLAIAILNEGMSRRQFAACVGVAESSISRLEAGMGASSSTAKTIADYFGCTIAELMPLEDVAA